MYAVVLWNCSKCSVRDLVCPSQPFTGCLPSLFARLHFSKPMETSVLRVPHDKGSLEKRWERWISALNVYKRCWPIKHGHSKKIVFLFTLLRQHDTTVLWHSYSFCSKPLFSPLVSTPVFAHRFLTVHWKSPEKNGFQFMYLFCLSYLFLSAPRNPHSTARISNLLSPAVPVWHFLRYQLSSVDLRHPGCSDLGCYLGLELETSQGEVGMG